MQYCRPLFTLFLVLSSSAAVAGGMPDTSQMNILFIDIEDCAARVFGCYGDPICKTPNIDRLAATGVRFSAAHAQGVCCNPSRVSFLTGLRPSTTRIFQNSQPITKYLPAGTPTLPELIKKAGLYAANVSKLFHGRHETPQLAAFDRLELTARPPGWKGPKPILRFPPVAKELRFRPAPKNRDWRNPAYRRWHREYSSRWGASFSRCRVSFCTKAFAVFSSLNKVKVFPPAAWITSASSCPSSIPAAVNFQSNGSVRSMLCCILSSSSA